MSFDWKANWIWLKGERKQDYVYAHARRTFEIEGDVSSAQLAISANNIYILYINGEYVGRGPDRSEHRFPYFDTYDVADRLSNGTNVIAIDSYCITTETDRGRSWCLYGGKPGLLAQLDYSEGGVEKQICSDDSWRMIESPAWRKDAPRITRFLGFVEHYDADAARAIAGYKDADFDNSSWERPELLGIPPKGPVGNLLPKEIPFLVPKIHAPVSTGSIQRMHTFATNPQSHFGFTPDEPPTVATPPDGTTALTFDFGRTMGGMIMLSLEECCGGRMEISYGENTNTIVCEIVALPSEGGLKFTSFDWRGGRHVNLTFINVPKPTIVKSIRFVELEYPFPQPGQFEASDPMLGRIWRACRLTAHVATKDHPQDCVHREQALWISDLFVHTRTSAACFGDLTPFVKAFKQVLRNVNDEGILSVPGPCATGYHYGEDPLPWSEQVLTVPMTIAEIYAYTGDPKLPIFAAPAIKRILAHIARYVDERGLIEVNKAGLQALSPFIGWAHMLKAEGFPVCVNAEYVMCLRSAATIMRLAGDEATAKAYEVGAYKAAEAIQSLFYSKEDHLFIDGEKDGAPLNAFAPTTNALAVLAGLLPEGEDGAWAHAMENHPNMGKMLGGIDAAVALEAFFMVGAYDAARRLLDAFWGMFVRKGEPCVPERWVEGHDGFMAYDYHGVASRCHPYGASPAYLLHQYILGVKSLKPGMSKVIIAPNHMGLAHAMGRVPTPHGEIEVFWRRDDKEWYLEVTLPEGIEATVTLPRYKWGASEMVCDGEVIWRDDGWSRFKDDRLRKPHEDMDDEIQTTINTAGRHVITLAIG
jgi:alpha-L-rhamnosidase